MRVPTRPAPARCSSCGSVWPRRTARFCGRCGVALTEPTGAGSGRHDGRATGGSARAWDVVLIGLAALAGTLLLASVAPSVPNPFARGTGTAVELPTEADDRPSPSASPVTNVPKRWCRTDDGARFDCVRWRVTSAGPGPRSPVVVDGRLVSVADGEVVARDLVSGTRAWTRQGSPGDDVVLPPRSGPVTNADDRAVAATETAAGVEHWAAEPGTGPRAPRQSGAELLVLDDGALLLLGARHGDVRGRHPLADGERVEAVPPDGVVVGSSTRLTLLAGGGLDPRWEVAVEPATEVVHAGAERLVLLAPDGRLEALDTGSGELRWRSDALVGRTGRRVRATSERILATVASPDPGLIVLDARDGARLWRHAFRHASAIRSPAAEADGMVLVVEPRPFPALVALDAATGEHLWTAGTDETVRTDGLAVAGDFVLAPTGDEVLAIEAATGALAWRLDTPGARVVHSDPVVLTGNDGLLTLTVDATAVATAIPPPRTTGETYLP